MDWRQPYKKYSNQKTDKSMNTSGHSFGSKLEAAVYGELVWLQKGKIIRDLLVQQTVVLVDGPTNRRITYRADFKAFDLERGIDVWIEAKGFETPEWKLKLKLWRSFGPGRLWLYGGTHQRPKLLEIIDSDMLVTAPRETTAQSTAIRLPPPPES